MPLKIKHEHIYALVTIKWYMKGLDKKDYKSDRLQTNRIRQVGGLEEGIGCHILHKNVPW